MGAEGAGTLILFLEEAPRETLLFDRLTPTPKAPKGVHENPLQIIEKQWKSLKTIGNH